MNIFSQMISNLETFFSFPLSHSISVKALIALCIICFAAAAVDAIAGGGGLISLPAYMLVGMPTYLALGTNKFSSSFGSLTSCFGYLKSKKVNIKLIRILFPFTLIGAALGVKTVLQINETYMQTIVLVLVVFVGIYTLFSKSYGIENTFEALDSKSIVFGIFLAFSIGFYDGFFGPGAGSFLIFGMIKIFGFDFVNASGNAKFLNLTSNITALILFALHGQIDYIIGVPVAIFMIFGGRFGTKLALKKGVGLVKPIFVSMSLAIAAKMLFSIIK